MLNHAAVPATQLTALAKELLEGTEVSELGEQVAQILLEAARTAVLATSLIHRISQILLLG